MKDLRVVSFDKDIIKLSDGTELPAVFEIDPDITLEELNELYVKSCKYVESLKDVGSNNHNA